MSPLLRLFRRLRAVAQRCPADCGAADPLPAYRDVSFADGQVSPDQAAITDALPPLLTASTRLLHVGVGCSDLAARFSAHVGAIDGITVLEDERAVAERLGLPNYRVSLLNKHAPALARLPGPYDVIVDNNPGSFACCIKHFRATMDTYAGLLAPGGRVVTHARGARWRQPGAIRLRWRNWAAEGRRVGLTPERITDEVWAWRRGDAGDSKDSEVR